MDTVTNENVKETEPILECPHCKEFVIIEKLNCGIFRHGIYKTNGIQIPPHSSKEKCDYYANNQLIYGCGKPFRIILDNNNHYNIEICEYI